jgi:hypothetical protein
MTTEHSCCWHHRTNTTLTTYPPRWEEICCHCGKVEWRTPPKPAPPPGHGQFFPHPQPYTVGGAWKTFSPASCACNPANGGSGVCGCVLGSGTVTF